MFHQCVQVHHFFGDGKNVVLVFRFECNDLSIPVPADIAFEAGIEVEAFEIEPSPALGEELHPALFENDVQRFNICFIAIDGNEVGGQEPVFAELVHIVDGGARLIEPGIAFCADQVELRAYTRLL